MALESRPRDFQAPGVQAQHAADLGQCAQLVVHLRLELDEPRHDVALVIDLLGLLDLEGGDGLADFGRHVGHVEAERPVFLDLDQLGDIVGAVHHILKLAQHPVLGQLGAAQGSQLGAFHVAGHIVALEDC